MWMYALRLYESTSEAMLNTSWGGPMLRYLEIQILLYVVISKALQTEKKNVVILL